MIGIGTECFIQIPGDSKKRILYPFQVVGIADDSFVLESEENGLPIEAAMEIRLFFERNREFMQQSARIDSVDAEDQDASAETDVPQRMQLTLQTIGEPVSAESRQVYRVSTALTDYTAELNGEKSCPVLDVSSTGLSVVSKECYVVGNMATITIKEDGKTYVGEVCVQSARDLGKGRTRYGLHCASSKKGPATLSEGLHKASLRYQREQLRRLAGSH